MANVRFYLRNKNSKQPTAIMARMYYDGKEYICSAKESVLPKYWNQDKNKVRETIDYPEHIWINQGLENVKDRILNVYRQLKLDNVEITNELIERRLCGKTDDTVNLYDHIRQVIKNREANSKPGRDGKDYTIHKYKKAFEKLQQFADTVLKRDLQFDDINLDFYNNYIKFLKSIGHAENTVGKELKTLKRFMNLATTTGINTNLIYQSRDFKTVSKKITHIYLDETEVNILFSLDLSDDKDLDEIRDLFVIGCRTSLRVSDYDKCVGDTVDANGLITIEETEKTEEPVYLPMHWQVRHVISKYKGVPPIRSDNQINDKIKRVCLRAGIQQKVRDTRQGKNRKSDEVFCHKYELVTTHTARRSCITNMYMAGFDLYFLMGVSGHTKIESLLNYIGVSKKLNAMRYLENPYFRENKNEDS